MSLNFIENTIFFALIIIVGDILSSQNISPYLMESSDVYYEQCVYI